MMQTTGLDDYITMIERERDEARRAARKQYQRAEKAEAEVKRLKDLLSFNIQRADDVTAERDAIENNCEMFASRLEREWKHIEILEHKRDELQKRVQELEQSPDPTYTAERFHLINEKEALIKRVAELEDCLNAINDWVKKHPYWDLNREPPWYQWVWNVLHAND